VAARVGGPVERHWSNPNAHRLIYAAAPFRTATLKTLTAFNFRWPSILFSLVWTTFSRTGCPATPSACFSRLRQGNYLSSPSFPSCRIRRLLLPVPPFLSPCSSHSRLHRVLKDVSWFEISRIDLVNSRKRKFNRREQICLYAVSKKYFIPIDFKRMNLLILTLNLSNIELFLHQLIWQDSIRGWNKYKK